MSRIDWIVDRRHAAVLDLFPVADEVIAIDPSGPWRQTVAVVRALREDAYDVVIDAQGLLKSAVLARLAGGRRTIGFAREALREPAAVRFYTETVAPVEPPITSRARTCSCCARWASTTRGSRSRCAPCSRTSPTTCNGRPGRATA